MVPSSLYLKSSFIYFSSVRNNLLKLKLKTKLNFLELKQTSIKFSRSEYNHISYITNALVKFLKFYIHCNLQKICMATKKTDCNDQILDEFNFKISCYFQKLVSVSFP